jgi:hypothetical protein
MRIGGIDPGKSGSMVVLESICSEAWYHKFKFNKDNLLDWHGFHLFLDLTKPEMIIIEKIRGRGASPKDKKTSWGASQNFNMGYYFGQIVIATISYCKFMNIRWKFVKPKAWQALIHDGISTKLTPKERSLIAYEQLHPNSPIKPYRKGGKINHNIVDGLLVATYGIMKFTKDGLQQWEFIE